MGDGPNRFLPRRRAARAARMLGAAIGVAVAVPCALGQVAPADAERPADDAPPSLDELLGITEEQDEGRGTAEDAADRELGEELQRHLDEETIGDAFEEAIAKMGLAADQLDLRFDTGLGTQRIQEDVLAKLAQLLDDARRQQSQGGGSSSSSASARSASSPGKQGQRAPSPSPQRQPGDSDPNAGDPPPARGTELNTVFEEERTEWGNLPQRVRDMLLQGRQEKFSTLYEQLTREYYRRLAEEGSP